MNNKPNLNKIIADNLDKANFQSKSNLRLPKRGWLDNYANGGYISSSAKATQFGQYKRGGGYFLEYHSYAPPRMDGGGDISIPNLDADKWLTKYQSKGQVTFSLPDARDLQRQMMGSNESTSAGVSSLKRDPDVEKEIAFQKFINSQPQFKQGHKELPYEKRIREERLRKEAQENSELAQTMGLFTPSGYNPGAGAAAAESFVNMTPGIGIIPASARLSNFLTSQQLGNQKDNVYFSKENNAAQNALGALNLAGDVGMINMHLPNVKPIPGVYQKSMIPSGKSFRNWVDDFYKSDVMGESLVGNTGNIHELEVINSNLPRYELRRNYRISEPGKGFLEFDITKNKGEYPRVGHFSFFNPDVTSADEQLKFFMKGLENMQVDLPATGSTSMYSQPLMNTNIARMAATPGKVQVENIGIKDLNDFIKNDIGQTYAEQLAIQFPKLQRSYNTLSQNTGINFDIPRIIVEGKEIDPARILNIKDIEPWNTRIVVPEYNLKKHFTKGGVIKDDRGQWAHPGEITEIGSNRITMQGVPYPVLGIGGDGQKIMMHPEQEYIFNEAPVKEIPMKKTGGWLKKYQVGGPSLILGTPGSTLMKWASHKPTTADLAVNLADPSGLSNVPFVTNSVRNMIENPSWGNLADVGWNILGSIPIFGQEVKAARAAETTKKLAQTASKSRTVGRAIGRPVGKAVRAVDKVITAPARVVDAGWKAAGITPVIGKTLMNANLWNRGERAYEAGLKGLVEGLNYVSPGQTSSEENKASAQTAKSVNTKTPVKKNDRYLESGMITDKGSNVTHVIKNGKVVKSFPVLTGQSRDVNANPYSVDYLETHPEARATPVGTYFSEPNPNIYGAPGFNMNPIVAFGQPAPQASNLAQHVTYGAFGHDPKEYARRSALYNQEAAKRAGSYGCTNCRKPDINYVTSSFPQGDTTIVVDSRRQGDLNFLREKYGIKETGGQINWLNKYK